LIKIDQGGKSYSKEVFYHKKIQVNKKVQGDCKKKLPFVFLRETKPQIETFGTTKIILPGGQ
jgi:hypothetical protein